MCFKIFFFFQVTEFNLDAVNKNDMDYIAYYPFAVNWKNTFLDAENRIDQFKLYFSSYPGGMFEWLLTFMLLRNKWAFNQSVILLHVRINIIIKQYRFLSNNDILRFK